MAQEEKAIDVATYEAQRKRLEEIRGTVFGELSDEEVLEYLAERRRLKRANDAYEQAAAEQNQKAVALQEKRESLFEELRELNEAINPERSDEELLSLVKKRRAVEATLAQILAELGEPVPAEFTDSIPSSPETTPSSPSPDNAEQMSHKAVPSEPVVSETEKPEKEEKQEAAVEPEPEVGSRDNAVGATPEIRHKKKKNAAQASDERFGREQVDLSLNEGEAKEFLAFLDQNPEEALNRLEALSPQLRRNKNFMLAIAKRDPAYAMHYADSRTLKKDEDFNIRIAAMENPRNSGNPLAEMLAEMRTPAVILAAVKNDYRNIRYATPSMDGYEEMLTLAKQQALERVKEIGLAADVRMLLPKSLRSDGAFMKDVEAVLEKLRKQAE